MALRLNLAKPIGGVPAEKVATNPFATARIRAQTSPRKSTRPLSQKKFSSAAARPQRPSPCATAVTSNSDLPCTNASGEYSLYVPLSCQAVAEYPVVLSGISSRNIVIAADRFAPPVVLDAFRAADQFQGAVPEQPVLSLP